MSSYIIEGGRKLEGEIEVSGSKNASLPILAATILNKGNTKLYNVPNIHDTKITQEILKYLGCKIKKNSDKIEINTKKVTKIIKIKYQSRHRALDETNEVNSNFSGCNSWKI